MIDKIKFVTSCAVCDHRNVCKYNEICIRGGIQVKLESIAPDIPAPFIIEVRCPQYK